MQTLVTLINIHGPLILPYISNTVKWIHIFHEMISQVDVTNAFILSIGNCDLYFMVQ